MAETSEQRIERMLAERTSQRSQRAIDESADQSFRTDQVDRIRSRMERKTATSARHAEDTSDAAREASFSGHIDLPPLAPHDVDSLFDSDTLLASVNAQLDHVASKLGLSHSSKSINALLDYSVGSDLGLTIAKGLGGGSGPNKKDRVDTKSASTLLQEIANTKSPSRTQQASLFPSRMNFNTDPRTAAEDDGGPFDISELWAAASPADSEATQTTVSSADREEDTSYKQGSIAFRVSHEDDATDSVHRIDQLQTRSTKQPPTLFKPAQASSTPSRAAQRIPLSSSSSATVKPNQSILAPKTPMASKNTPKKMQAQRSSSAPRPRSAQKPSTPSQQHTIKPGAKAAKVLPPPPPPVIASKQRAASAGRVRSQATAAASDLMPASHYSLSSFRDVDNDNDTDNHVSSGPYEYVAASPPRTEPRKKEVVRGGARGNTSTTVDSRATRGRRKSEEEGEEGEGEGRVFVNPRSLRMIAASYPRDTEARIEQLAVPKAKILAAKTEKIRRELEEEELAECTFKPKTGRGPKNPPQSLAASSSAFDRLYEYHQRSDFDQRRVAEIRAREEEELAECTFRPRINPLPSPSSHLSSPQDDDIANNRDGFLKDDYHSDRHDQWRSRSSRTSSQRPSSASAAAASRSRPQSPAPPPRSSYNGASVADQPPLYARVGEVLRTKSEKIARARIEAERSIMGRGGEGGGSESESFKPQLNKKSIQMALEKEERERRALEEAGLVDESSDLIVAAGGGRGRGPEGAGERLYRSAILKKQLSYIESQQQAQTLTQRGGSGQGRMANGTKGGSLGRSSSFSGGGLGFGEQVAQAGAQTSTSIMNDKSRAILSKSKDIPQLGFLERQAHLAAVASERKAIYRSLVENAECTFRPALLVNSGGGGGGWDRDGDVRDTTWSRGDGGGGGGSFGGREGERDLSSSIAKLAYTDVRRSQALKEALADHYYGQLSFSPDINPKSRAMAKARSVEELHEGKGIPHASHRHAKAAVEAAAVEREAELCAFKPSLNPKSLAMAEEQRRIKGGGREGGGSVGGGGIIESIAVALEKQKAKAHRLQEERALREYEELKVCTFTPMINKDPLHLLLPAPPPPAGTARHLELVALAKKKAEEQRKVEEKVFKTHPKGNPNLYTVPQPFALSQPKSASRYSSPAKQRQGGELDEEYR